MGSYRVKRGYSNAAVGLGCLGIIMLVLLMCAVSAFLGGLIVYLLWNALVPVLFGGVVITYWTAVLIGLALGFIGSIFTVRVKGS